MLHLHRNNRMEQLLSALGDVLSVPRRNFFQPEVIIVQSLGMEQWLTMGLANRFGVWANAEYPFPRAFIEDIGERVLGPSADAKRYSRDALALHLACLLGDLPEDEALAPLQSYMASRPGVVARLELADQLADAFDQIQVYRPDWFIEWTSPATPPAISEYWPALLRALLVRLGPRHFPAQILELVERIERGTVDLSLLPERVSLFGVATLPPAFIRIFDALARHIPVHWYLLTASREYLGDECGKLGLVDTKSTMVGQQLDAGNALVGSGWSNQQPLIASYGRIMRDIDLLLERDCNYVEGAGEPPVESGTTSVLATLQSDLYALRRRGSSPEAPKLPLRSTDRSVEIHACHGPRRELEVLRELLLVAFERDPSLRPEDVIVLLRDVETYAPLVDAVFGGERGQVGTIPYILSDRNMSARTPIVEAMIALLELGARRLTAAELMRAVELAPVAARFHLDIEELPQLREWLRLLNVTWGVDLGDRARAGGSGQREHTLRFGLARLLLGVACEPGGRAPWHGILPVDVEGEAAELAGRFVECAETLFGWRRDCEQMRTFAAWQQQIALGCKSLLCVADADAWQLADLLETLGCMTLEAARAGFDEPVPAQVIVERLRRAYERKHSAPGLFSGGVTFCAMLPMRGIPARYIAMIGLDDGAFPRPVQHSSFDVVARSRARPGDRAGREEDRHLFLETLLAARERLIITYQGKNPRDDSPLPRSVVVDELLAVTDESFELESRPEVKPSSWLVLHHPLHPHGSKYFDGSDTRMEVRDERQFAAAMALESTSPRREVGMQRPLSPVDVGGVTLEQLESFWGAPANYFYQTRLGALLDRERPDFDSLDPTELDGLGRHRLTTLQLRTLSEGRSKTDGLVIWTASGERPFSVLGKILYDEQQATSESLHRLLDWARGSGVARTLDLTLRVRDIELVGTVSDVFANGRVDFGPSRISAKHRLWAWLRHLLFNAAGVSLPTLIVRRGDTPDATTHVERIEPLDTEAARLKLEVLVSAFLLGQQAPLPFFADQSWDYARHVHQGEDVRVALERVRRAWGDPLSDEGDGYRRPVGPREVLRLFGAEPPLDESWPQRFGVAAFPSFAQISEAVFSPYLAAARPVDPAELVRPWADSALSASDAGVES